MNKNTEEILRFINHSPDLCECTKHTFTIRGIKFWTANGFLFCAPDDDGIPGSAFSLCDRWRIYSAYKKWVRNCGVDVLTGRDWQ